MPTRLAFQEIFKIISTSQEEKGSKQHFIVSASAAASRFLPECLPMILLMGEVAAASFDSRRDAYAFKI